jgi:carbohydrate-binding DOMON domain-containing protein
MNYVRPRAMIMEKVFDFLYLSAPQMFQAPNMIVMAIAATRMYRSIDIVNPRETPQGNKRTVVSDMRVRSVPVNQTDVSVPSTEYGQYLTSQSGSASYISTDPHERYKAHEVSFNVDVESGPEK